MPSAKQIAWRKKFAKLYGKKKKGAKSSQKQVINSIKSQIKSGRPSSNMQDYLRKKYPKMTKDQMRRAINKAYDEYQKK
tara:strand:+ start:2028 stop:2264 length:237 start_codon:yes stop_codon:yes gene_type:complete